MGTVASPTLWIGFVVFVLGMLALDLGVFHRKAHAVTLREAVGWSAVWVSLALAFNVFVWWKFGPALGVEFLTGYLIEKSLSVDNIFVFIVIFGALAVPPALQHRVLFWGIIGALVLRAVMIFAGAAMLAKFHWLIYVFGGFLVFTGIKLFVQRDATEDPSKGLLMRTMRRLVPTTSDYRGSSFVVREGGKLVATPLLLALVLIEATDVIFAVDSIPAIFAVTKDPFIVFTSNIFAILGLRSLFFLLAGVVEKFSYLKVGLAGVLVFVGAKMTLVDVVKIPAFVSLAAITTMLGASIVASLIKAQRVSKKAATATTTSAPPPIAGQNQGGRAGGSPMMT
jgi:tellurite resistance protein TerC